MPLQQHCGWISRCSLTFSGQQYFYISFRSFRPDCLSIFNGRGVVFPVKARFHVHVFDSEVRQLCSMLYPVCQLHHICCVDAEEDVEDFRLLRPCLELLQVVVSFLTSPMFSAIAWSGSSKISCF